MSLGNAASFGRAVAGARRVENPVGVMDESRASCGVSPCHLVLAGGLRLVEESGEEREKSNTEVLPSAFCTQCGASRSSISSLRRDRSGAVGVAGVGIVNHSRGGTPPTPVPSTP